MADDKIRVSYDNSNKAGTGGFVTGTERPADPTKIDLDVSDAQSHTKLDAIISALGGSSNTTPTIFNVTCTLADTEYSQALPANCKRFILRARGNSTMQFYYSTAASNIFTIPAGNSFEDANLYSSQTIYFKCSIADEVVEIIAYA